MSGVYPAIQCCDFSVLSIELSLYVIFSPSTILSTSHSFHSSCSGLQNRVFVLLGLREDFSWVHEDMGSVIAVKSHILNFHIDTSLFLSKPFSHFLSLSRRRHISHSFIYLPRVHCTEVPNNEKILYIGVDIYNKQFSIFKKFIAPVKCEEEPNYQVIIKHFWWQITDFWLKTWKDFELCYIAIT